MPPRGDELSPAHRNFISSHNSLFDGPFYVVGHFHPKVMEARSSRWSLQFMWYIYSAPSMGTGCEFKLSDAASLNCTVLMWFSLAMCISRMFLALVLYKVPLYLASSFSLLDLIVFRGFSSRLFEYEDSIGRWNPTTKYDIFSFSPIALQYLWAAWSHFAPDSTTQSLLHAFLANVCHCMLLLSH